MKKEKKHRIAVREYNKVKYVSQPSSFLGMVAVKEKVADRCGGPGGCGEGDGERPFLQQPLLK